RAASLLRVRSNGIRAVIGHKHRKNPRARASWRMRRLQVIRHSSRRLHLDLVVGQGRLARSLAGDYIRSSAWGAAGKGG
ncbi:MAG: hypothetical protein ACREDV_11180, partial [Methylocella sp.]